MVTKERKDPGPEVGEENTHDKILGAAGEVFAEQGFEGATIRAITERAAQLQLSDTRIFAPFDGRVTKKSIEPGNYVQPGQTLFLLVPPAPETQRTRLQTRQK